MIYSFFASNDFEIVSLLNESDLDGAGEEFFDWWRELENSQQTSMELYVRASLLSIRSIKGGRYEYSA